MFSTFFLRRWPTLRARRRNVTSFSARASLQQLGADSGGRAFAFERGKARMEAARMRRLKGWLAAQGFVILSERLTSAGTEITVRSPRGRNAVLVHESGRDPALLIERLEGILNAELLAKSLNS